nr:imidazole glycerol phosphate synthase hisHF, chloroplastic [Tanacetum cinerariifolium]
MGERVVPLELTSLPKLLRNLELTLLNRIDCNGPGKGFNIDLIKLISDAVSIPVIASSGAGTTEMRKRSQ